MSPLRIPFKLKLAINSYYAFQRAGWLHEAEPAKYWKPPTGWKEGCLAVISEVARHHDMTFSACAGRLWFARGKQEFYTDDPLPIWEYKA